MLISASQHDIGYEVTTLSAGDKLNHGTKIDLNLSIEEGIEFKHESLVFVQSYATVSPLKGRQRVDHVLYVHDYHTDLDVFE